jgi:hypothetical protein
VLALVASFPHGSHKKPVGKEELLRGNFKLVAYSKIVAKHTFNVITNSKSLCIM